MASFSSFGDMFDGGGPGASGDTFSGGPLESLRGSSSQSSGDSSKSNLFSSIGSLVGMIAGGPGGSVVGNVIGSMIGGNSLQGSLTSGIGSLAQGLTMGPAGIMTSALGGMTGSNSGSQNVGQNILGLLGGKRSASGGGSDAGLSGIMNIANATGASSPLGLAILAETLQPKGPIATPLQQAQMATGERVPSYQGTPAPDPRSSNNFSYSRRPIVRAAIGGLIEGPGTGTSDDIPAQIYQNGGPVQEAMLSDGEFVMTADAVRGAGNGNRAAGAAEMYKLMNNFERRT